MHHNQLTRCFLYAPIIAALTAMSINAPAQVNHQDPPFPAIVNLQAVLDMASANHPKLQLASADVELQQAQLAQLKWLYSGQLYLNLKSNSADVNDAPETDSINDNRAELIVLNYLADFELQSAIKHAIKTKLLSAEAYRKQLERFQRIKIMRRYFDVILADYQYSVDDEAMTVAFFPYDRALDRQEKYGDYSTLQVKQKEAVFRRSLSKRAQSELQQRATRLRLALALNQPDAKPDQLEYPILDQYQRDLPEYEHMLKQALEKCPLLTSLRQQYKAQQQLLDVANPTSHPASISINLETRDAAVNTTSSDSATSVVKLKVPILNDKQANILHIQSELLKLKAQLRQREFSIRERILDLVQQLEFLQSEYAAAEVESEYRELDLDKTRALYEMEVRARIGSASTKMAEALYNNARIEFERVIAWEKLDAIVGNEAMRFPD